MEKLINHNNFKGNLEDEKGSRKNSIFLFIYFSNSFFLLQIADLSTHSLIELKYQMPFTR